MKLEDFIGKEVLINPDDTRAIPMVGIIEEISDKGFLIKITYIEDSATAYNRYFKVGDIYFVSHGKGLTFKSI